MYTFTKVGEDEGRDELDDEGDHQADSGGDGADGFGAFVLVLEVKQHDDEEEKHHHRAGVNQDLDDTDKEGAETDKEPGETDETGDDGERAGNGISECDHRGPTDEHDGGEEPE